MLLRERSASLAHRASDVDDKRPRCRERTSGRSESLGAPVLAGVCPQRKQFLADRGLYRPLDLSIVRNQREAEGRELGPAAVSAALLRFDRRTSADAFDFIHEKLRPPVRHVHRPARARDRVAGMNILKQFDFAVSDVPFRIQIDANT